jgi:hypothetical protein
VSAPWPLITAAFNDMIAVKTFPESGWCELIAANKYNSKDQQEKFFHKILNER